MPSSRDTVGSREPWTLSPGLQGGRVPEGFLPTWFQTARPSHPPHILPTFPALTSLWHLPTFRLYSSCITVRHARQCRVREGRDWPVTVTVSSPVPAAPYTLSNRF